MKKELRQNVWKKYNCKCAYCGEPLMYEKMQIDHIDAKYLGGKDYINNYNPSCRECNFYKSTFTIEKFREQLTTIIERIKKPFIVRLALKYGIISFKPFDGKFYFEKQSQQLIIADVTPRFSVSLVYQNQTANMLRTLVTDANSKEEALGKAIQYFNKETDGFGLILKSVTHLNEG